MKARVTVELGDQTGTCEVEDRACDEGTLKRLFVEALKDMRGETVQPRTPHRRDYVKATPPPAPPRAARPTLKARLGKKT